MDDKFMENSCRAAVGEPCSGTCAELANKFLFIPSNAHYFSRTVLETFQ